MCKNHTRLSTNDNNISKSRVARANNSYNNNNNIILNVYLKSHNDDDVLINGSGLRNVIAGRKSLVKYIIILWAHVKTGPKTPAVVDDYDGLANTGFTPRSHNNYNNFFKVLCVCYYNNILNYIHYCTTRFFSFRRSGLGKKMKQTTTVVSNNNCCGVTR